MAGLLCLKWNNHSLAFLNVINNLYEKDLYCDATIACHGKYYPVHRMVLSTCSEYFEEIFRLTQCKHPFVIVNDIQPKELEALLSYMYKGDVNVLQDMLPSLIKAAEALKIKGLAVPDELPPEKVSSSASKKRSQSSSSNVNSKKSRLTEEHDHNKSDKTVSDSTNRDGSNEILPINLDSSLPLSEVKAEPLDPDLAAFVGSNQFGSTEQASNIKNEPYDDAESSSQQLDNCDVPEKEFAFSESIGWSTDMAGNEAPNDGTESAGMEYCVDSLSSIIPSTTIDAISTQLGPLLAELPSTTGKPTPTAYAPSPTYDGFYNCTLCDHKCRQKGNLLRHMKRIHTGEKPFSCSFCSYRCVAKDTLRTHLRTHTGEKPYKCSFCPVRFSDRSNWVKHFKFCKWRNNS